MCMFLTEKYITGRKWLKSQNYLILAIKIERFPPYDYLKLCLNFEVTVLKTIKLKRIKYHISLEN